MPFQYGELRRSKTGFRFQKARHENQPFLLTYRNIYLKNHRKHRKYRCFRRLALNTPSRRAKGGRRKEDRRRSWGGGVTIYIYIHGTHPWIHPFSLYLFFPSVRYSPQQHMIQHQIMFRVLWSGSSVKVAFTNIFELRPSEKVSFTNIFEPGPSEKDFRASTFRKSWFYQQKPRTNTWFPPNIE